MKIDQNLVAKLNSERKDIRQTQTNSVNFQTLVRSNASKLQIEQLNRLIGEIEAQGERLAKGKNLRDLAKFKQLVKRFLKETVDFGMEVSEEISWGAGGSMSSLQLVKLIDEKLIELTDDLMKNESESIHLLNTIGEIKGLLINLYT
ncbi:YaaR family protein [Gottfriedia luciferensis]|uniref:YaaR family protein n=1 Tax=Gottfriedia luciferensis TaxID=178774 RepID=UPI000B447BBF|nr:YaaR family protein [Gottfriedia luciferensis]